MPNHYHLLVRPEADNALAPFIQRLFNSYTQRFNRVWRRSGTLFERRARSVPVESEQHVLHLCRYIHLNPVKAGLVRHPGQWPFSNYREWVGWRRSDLFDADVAMTYFATARAYEEFVTCGTDPALKAQLQAFCFD
jgi:putative transposase